MNEPERKSITTRIRPDLKQKAQIQAAKEGRRVADIIEDALIAYLATKPVKAS